MRFSFVLASILLAGSMEPQAQTSIQSRIDVLMSGTFQEALSAGRVVLADSRLAYGTSRADVVGFLGEPDFESEDLGSICYKTAAGPLWLDFDSTGLIKKSVVHPAHWNGTDDELAELWNEKRETDTWYEW